MVSYKNRIMLLLSSLAVIISLIVHFLHRTLDMFEPMVTGRLKMPTDYTIIVNILLVIPLILLLSTVFIYSQNKDHPIIPVMITLILTFASISTISGGDGMTEYHFSIFMVMAILAYYEDIKLCLIMTIIFAVQHLSAYLFAPELVYGLHLYSFSMVLIHAVFLILTFASTAFQIYSGNKYSQSLLVEKDKKQSIINDILVRLSLTSKQTLTTAKDLSEAISQTTRSTNHISSSIQEIATGAESQVIRIQKNFKTIENMVASINEIVDVSNMVSTASSETTKVSGQGKESIEKAIHQMNSINTAANNSAYAVKQLCERFKEVGNIVQVITGIATQTNLLALNAAIEAARAGENGRSFAVVANEIRNLADQSANSASQISELIKEIEMDTNQSATVMDDVTREAKLGVDVAVEAGSLFEKILNASESVIAQIKHISSASEQMSANSAEVISSIEEISNISRESSGNCQGVAASSQEQLALMEELSASSEALSKMANDLNLLVEKVKLS